LVAATGPNGHTILTVSPAVAANTVNTAIKAVRIVFDIDFS
jgi:hypothetical protein